MSRESTVFQATTTDVLALLRAEAKKITENPTADHWNNLGVRYHEVRDDEKSKLCYEEALTLDPNHAVAHENLGQLYYSARNFEEARKHWKIAESKGNSDAKLFLLLLEMHDISRRPSVDQWYQLGLDYCNATHGKNVDYEKAKLCFQEAIRLFPDYAEAHYRLGLMSLYGHGQVKSAAKAKAFFNTANLAGHLAARSMLIEIENNEGPGLVRTQLIPRLLSKEVLTIDEKKLCVTHKEVIVNYLMTVHQDDLDMLREAVNKHTVLGDILFTHRKKPSLFNLFHRADTGSVALIIKRVKKLEKERLQTESAHHTGVVTGVVAAPVLLEKTDPLMEYESVTPPQPVRQPTRRRVASLLFPPVEQQDSVNREELIHYARIFNDWAKILFKEKYDLSAIEVPADPLAEAERWKSALTPDEKEQVKSSTRSQYQNVATAEQLEVLLEGAQIPEDERGDIIVTTTTLYRPACSAT